MSNQNISAFRCTLSALRLSINANIIKFEQGFPPLENKALLG